MFWLDVLDAPFVRGQNWMFYAEYPGQDLQPPGRWAGTTHYGGWPARHAAADVSPQRKIVFASLYLQVDSGAAALDTLYGCRGEPV